MSQNCRQWLNELRAPIKVVLDDDLAALSKMDDRLRIEDYNELKSNEQEFRREFRRECPDKLRDDEPETLRARFRFARLLIVASFALDGGEANHDRIPESLSGEFDKAAIEAVVDFERYKQFDKRSEEQINRRIRRMEGEVYELVKNYTNTQLANMDDFLEKEEAQGDIMDLLSDRYEDRLERIRQGLYTYIEYHGINHMVEAVEEAVESVASAQETGGEVDRKMAEQLEALQEAVSAGFERQDRRRQQQLRAIEQELASSNPDIEALKDEIATLDTGPSTGQKQALKRLESTIEETADLKGDLEAEIENLRKAKTDAEEAGEEEVASKVASIVDGELSALEEQRTEVASEVERLRQERERLEASSEHLESRQAELAERVEEIESSTTTEEGGLDGERAVTSTIARLLEMDYIGRFESSVHDTLSIRLADETRSITDGYWENRSERRSERPRLRNFLDDDEDPEQYPVNTSARFIVDSGGLLGLGGTPDMVIEAAVCSDLEAHATNGFDASPATLDTLLEYVNRSVYEAEQTDVEMLLGIASPTGWSEAVRQQITREGLSRTKYSRRVSIVLIDLSTGELVYDTSDPVADENAHLFELPVDRERQAACEEELMSRFDGIEFGSDGVVLETLVEEAGFEPHVVKRTFNRISSREGYEQRYVDDDLVLFQT